MRAISAILHGVPGAFVFLLQTNTLTPNRPLGHPEISTGSPRVFHLGHARFRLGHASVLPFANRAPFAVGAAPLRSLRVGRSRRSASPPGTHSSPVIPTHRRGMGIESRAIS